MLETFCNCLISEDDTNSELTEYLKHISFTSIENIDLDIFVSWNDIRFYNSLFDIIDKTQNENLRDLAKSCLPRKESIITVVYERLFSKITPKIDENGNEINIEDEFDEDDRKFYLKVRDIIKDDACCKKYLKEDGVSKDEMSVSFNTEAKRDEFLNQLHTGFKISDNESISVSKDTLTSLISWKKKIKKYDMSDPIFIRGADDKIYTFDEYPERKMDITPIEYYGVVSIEEKMCLDGVNTDEIQKCKSAFRYLQLTQSKHSKLEKISKDTKLLGELKDIASIRSEEDEERYA